MQSGKLGRNWVYEPSVGEQTKRQRLLILKHHNVMISFAVSFTHQPPPPVCVAISPIYVPNRAVVYLSTVIDLATRMVVGWAVSDRITAAVAVDALHMAHQTGYAAGNAVFHSDRKSHYTSHMFADYTRKIDVQLSVGNIGMCWDNAVAESLFSTGKLHMFYDRKMFHTKLQARVEIGQWIETYYNRRRIHSTTGTIPTQAMKHFFSPEILAHQAAWPNKNKGFPRQQNLTHPRGRTSY